MMLTPPTTHQIHFWLSNTLAVIAVVGMLTGRDGSAGDRFTG